jgi:hypothetical protein
MGAQVRRLQADFNQHNSINTYQLYWLCLLTKRPREEYDVLGHCVLSALKFHYIKLRLFSFYTRPSRLHITWPKVLSYLQFSPLTVEGKSVVVSQRTRGHDEFYETL